MQLIYIKFLLTKELRPSNTAHLNANGRSAVPEYPCFNAARVFIVVLTEPVTGSLSHCHHVPKWKKN